MESFLITYWGIALAGKTSNLEALDKLIPQRKSIIVMIAILSVACYNQEKLALYRSVNVIVEDLYEQIVIPKTLQLNGEPIGTRQFKPGTYDLFIQHPGYYEIKEKLEIRPGKEPFIIKKILTARPRRLSIPLTRDNRYTAQVVDVFINDKKVTSMDSFLPGKYGLIVKLRTCKTVKEDIFIPPGEGSYCIDFPIVKLREYEFYVSENYLTKNGTITIDGITYKLKIYVDGTQIEEHHIYILSNQMFGLICGLFYGPEEIKVARTEIGYYYGETLIKKEMKFRDLEINGEELLKHLEKLSQTERHLI